MSNCKSSIEETSINEKIENNMIKDKSELKEEKNK
jgi:hypothetical protein